MAGYIDFYEDEIGDDFIFSNPMNFFPRQGDYVKLFAENGNRPICAGKVASVSWEIPLDSILNERISVVVETGVRPPESAGFREKTEKDPTSIVNQGFSMFGDNPDVFLLTFYADDYKTELAAIVGSTPPVVGENIRFSRGDQVIACQVVEVVWLLVEGGYGSELAIRVKNDSILIRHER